MSTDTKLDVRLYCHAGPAQYDRHYFKAKLAAVVITADGILNPTWNDYGNTRPAGHLQDFAVTAQGDESSPNLYGYRYGYLEVFCLEEIGRAEAILKTMRKVDKRLTALSDKFGYPTDFATYAARVADAIGVTARQPFIRPTSTSSRSLMYSNTEHQYMDTDGLRYWLQQEMVAWRPELATTA